MSHLKLVIDNTQPVLETESIGEHNMQDVIETELGLHDHYESPYQPITHVSKPTNKVAGFRYAKTKGMYTASNVSFNENTFEGLSYDWWVFVAKINGKLVFNNYSYSNSTRKHQYKMKYLLRTLGITIAMELDAPNGLQNLHRCVEHYLYLIESTNKLIANPRSKPLKNIERMRDIAEYKGKLDYIKNVLGYKYKKSA